MPEESLVRHERIRRKPDRPAKLHVKTLELHEENIGKRLIKLEVEMGAVHVRSLVFNVGDDEVHVGQVKMHVETSKVHVKTRKLHEENIGNPLSRLLIQDILITSRMRELMEC